MTDYPNNIPAKLEIIKASEITPKEVRWLWYPYIPFGKVTLLQGDPGDGKSTVVGLYLLPTSFWIISSGRTPPCSKPTVGSKSA